MNDQTDDKGPVIIPWLENIQKPGRFSEDESLEQVDYETLLAEQFYE